MDNYTSIIIMSYKNIHMLLCFQSNAASSSQALGRTLASARAAQVIRCARIVMDIIGEIGELLEYVNWSHASMITI